MHWFARHKRLSLLVILLGLLTTLNVTAERRPRRIVVNKSNYQPSQVVKPFPPILNPKHVSAKEGNEKLGPSELVLGVEIDGVARAYPINMLTGPTREIFNDTLGDHPIAATW